MRRIVKPNTAEPVVEIKCIRDNDCVGLTVLGEKFIVGSKKVDGDRSIRYSRMNDNFYMVSESYNSIQTLLNSVEFSDAFFFKDKKEAINWLIT